MCVSITIPYTIAGNGQNFKMPQYWQQPPHFEKGGKYLSVPVGKNKPALIMIFSPGSIPGTDSHRLSVLGIEPALKIVISAGW